MALKFSPAVQQVLDDARERRGDLELSDDAYDELGIRRGRSFEEMTDHELIQVLFLEARWAVGMLNAQVEQLRPKNRRERRASK